MPSSQIVRKELENIMRWKRVLLRSTRALFLLMMSAMLVLLFLLFSINSAGMQSARRSPQLRNRVPYHDDQRRLVNQVDVATEYGNFKNVLGKTHWISVSPNSSWVILHGNVVVHEGVEQNQHEFEYILNSEDVCDSLEPNRVGLLIFIASDVRHTKQRQAIRETYGLALLQKALNFRLVFLLGRSLTEGTQQLVRDEYYTYGDIVQENFTESFQNLGLKSVMGLKWFSAFCSKADYVMKTDDDIFLHVSNLLETLEKQPRKRLLLCHRNRVRKIVRKEKSLLLKYHVPWEDLPGTFFPEYCGGFGYVMSTDVALELYKTSLVTPYFFIEDVFVTGFCRHKAGTIITDHPGIALRPSLTPHQSSCAFREGRVTSHELAADEMRELWRYVNMKDYFCPRPVTYIKQQY